MGEGGGGLREPPQIWGGQHQVHILGSASQTPKYVILHTCNWEKSNIIEVDGYISLQDVVAPWGVQGNF